MTEQWKFQTYITVHDQTGRIVIPKQIRDKQNITSGATLEIIATPEMIQLKRIC